MSSLIASVFNPVVPMLSDLAYVFETAQAHYDHVPDVSKSIMARLSGEIRAEIEGKSTPQPAVAQNPPIGPSTNNAEIAHKPAVKPVDKEVEKSYMTTFRANLKGGSNALDS